ncbi:hypothetical protein [Rhizobium sullae]|uniref:hypothetical protein n=1 Tax=Rhizobium sullae TaxID=50338 RepID=UPI000B3619FC|nr:hypothetical protein [Rhizobium sullae]
MRIREYFTGKSDVTKAPSGAFFNGLVNKFDLLAVSRRFAHAPHDRAIVSDLRQRSRNADVSGAALLEAYLVWELSHWRRLDIPKLSLLLRWVQRFDPSLYAYLCHIDQFRQWRDIAVRSGAEFNRLVASGYEWPDRCEPYYHLSGIKALEGMRAVGAGLLSEQARVSLDPTPASRADTEVGTSGGDGSGGGDKRPTPKPKGEDEEPISPRSFFVPVDVVPEMLPPWISRSAD